MKGKISTFAAKILIEADLAGVYEEEGEVPFPGEVDGLLADGRYELESGVLLTKETDGWYAAEPESDSKDDFLREWARSIEEARLLAHRLKEEYRKAA